VDAEFSSELIERQQFRVARQINDRPSRALQNRGRNSTASAVPRPKRFDRRADQGRKRLLLQTNGTSKITKLARHERHDAIAGV
jgi:hypothetical protein